MLKISINETATLGCQANIGKVQSNARLFTMVFLSDRECEYKALMIVDVVVTAHVAVKHNGVGMVDLVMGIVRVLWLGAVKARWSFR